LQSFELQFFQVLKVVVNYAQVFGKRNSLRRGR